MIKTTTHPQTFFGRSANAHYVDNVFACFEYLIQHSGSGLLRTEIFDNQAAKGYLRLALRKLDNPQVPSGLSEAAIQQAYDLIPSILEILERLTHKCPKGLNDGGLNAMLRLIQGKFAAPKPQS